MSSQTHKTTLYLPLELHYALKTQAKQLNTSQAHLIREVLQTYITAEPKKQSRSIASASVDTIDSSEIKTFIRRNWAEQLKRKHQQ